MFDLHVLIGLVGGVGLVVSMAALLRHLSKRAPGPDRAPGSLPDFLLCSTCEAKQREGRLRVYGCDWCAIVSGVTRYEVIAYKDPEREREAWHALGEKRWGKLTRMCQWPITKMLLDEMAVAKAEQQAKAGKFKADKLISGGVRIGPLEEFRMEVPPAFAPTAFVVERRPPLAPLAPLAAQAEEGEFDGIKVGYRRVFKDGDCAGWVRQGLPAEDLLAAIKPWGPGAYHVTGPKPALVTVGDTGPGTGTWSGVGKSGDLHRVKAPKPGDTCAESWVDPEMRQFDGNVYALDRDALNGFWSLVGAGGWVFHIDWLEPVTT